MGRVCKRCEEYKEAEFFTPFSSGKNGLYPVCKPCRQNESSEKYLKERSEYKLFYRAKRRARTKGLEFTIKESDIKIPALCPVFKTPIDIPSLDRINSSKGYTPDNIIVMSNRANMLKNNGTLKEFEKIIEFLKSIGDIKDG